LLRNLRICPFCNNFTHRMRKLLVLLCLFSCIQAGAQHRREYVDMLVAHYTEEQGLANNIVYCSLKSRDGFLWFGTWYGLCRFDGAKFLAYNRSYATGTDQPPRKIESMAEDGQGNIWVKTLDWKLSVFFRDTETFHSVYDEIKAFSRNIQVIKIQPTDDGHVLLLTKDKNLLLARTTADGKVEVKLLASSKGHVTPFNDQLTANILCHQSGRISWVGKDYNIFSVKSRHTKLPPFMKASCSSAFQCGKELWFVGDKGITRYDLNTGKSMEVRDAPVNLPAVISGYVDNDGRLWIVEDRAAIVCYDLGKKTSHRFPFSLFGRICEPSFCDAGSHGIFFLTSAGEALYIDRNTMQMTNIARLPEMSDAKENSRYFSMNMDSDGQLWLTSTDRGFYRFNFPMHHFRMIQLPGTQAGGAANGIRSLYQAANGEVWVGTRNRDLYILDADGNLKRTYPYSDYRIGSVYYIMPDRAGQLWLSTKGDGLVKAVPDASVPGGYRFEHYKHDAADPKSISGNNVYITYQDSRGRIWAGTLDGGLNLMVEKNGKVEFKNKYNGFTSYPAYGLYMEVRNMVEDSSGRIWVGTIDGLMSFDAGFTDVGKIQFEMYRRKDLSTFANSDVYTLYKDSEQTVWLGAFGGGLSRITGYDAENHVPVFKPLGIREGLQSDVIVSMIEDSQGRLWLGNDEGLSCYERKRNRIRNFDKYDGFPDVQMEETASLRNSNGEIWMGCKQGILTFRPDRITASVLRYPVYIVGCTVNNMDIRSYADDPLIERAITKTKHLELQHNQNMFTLEFAALNYNNQNRVNYRYRLEGYDVDWHYSGHNRIASYTKVPSGKYRFRVEALDASNPSVSSSCELDIVILPPWWATWWAYLIYTVLALALLYASVRFALYWIRMRNDVYIQTKLSELKTKFYLEQKNKTFVENINRIIENNLENPNFNIDSIANEMGLSRSAFFKKIKSLTGCSPVEFVREYKLNKAVDLLKNTDMNITDIAYKTGFTDVGYFGKCFHKKFGLSPREFVNKQKKAYP